MGKPPRKCQPHRTPHDQPVGGPGDDFEGQRRSRPPGDHREKVGEKEEEKSKQEKEKQEQRQQQQQQQHQAMIKTELSFSILRN